MKKSIKALFLAMALTFALSTVVGCGGGATTTDGNNDDTTQQGGNTDEGVNDGGNTDNGTNNGGNTDNGTDDGGNANDDEVLNQNTLPTKAAIIQARQNVVDAAVQGYDFTVNLEGTVSALGFSKTFVGNYDGKYRYNKTTNDLQFKRTMSGELLYDSTLYVCTKGDQKMEIKMNGDNEVKKVSVLPNDDEDVTLINKPFVAIVNALTTSNLLEVKKSTGTGFSYEVGMRFDSDNALLKMLCGVLERLGTSISFKGVTVTNPFAGVQLYFNLGADNTLEDFKFALDLSFTVGESEQKFTLTYAQRGATSAITLPSTSGVIVDDAAMSTEIAAINASLADLKNDEDYSLDLLAKNELDPAWNKLAIVDSYTGRLYKNTDDTDPNNVWFNHSFKYKSHTEEDGAESFEYAIGNLTTGETYLASYKGLNTYELVNKTADTQFDYLLAPALQNVSNIDCMKKIVDENTTTYYMYLNSNGTATVQDYILDMVNSNTASGVTQVENYLSSDYIVKEAQVVVEVVDGKVSSVECLTEIKYCPTAGEYTEYNVTLTNTIALQVNEKLNKAQEYVAPEETGGKYNAKLESVL